MKSVLDDTLGMIAVSGKLRGQKIATGFGTAEWYIDDFVSDDGAVFKFRQSDIPGVICVHPAGDLCRRCELGVVKSDKCEVCGLEP